jgi:hypothetical protein
LRGASQGLLVLCSFAGFLMGFLKKGAYKMQRYKIDKNGQIFDNLHNCFVTWLTIENKYYMSKQFKDYLLDRINRDQGEFSKTDAMYLRPGRK